MVAQVIGYPKPKTMWFVDNDAIHPSKQIATEALENGTVTLEIPETSLDDCGKYRVEATNRHGVDSCETNLVVIPDGGSFICTGH